MSTVAPVAPIAPPPAGVTSKPGPQGADIILVQVYVIFQFLGQFGLLATVLTITFSKTVSRHITFTNFCITWILSTICYLLLTYGGQQLGPKLSPGLCLTQAASIYGAPPMTAVSTAVLVAQMWLTTRTRPSLDRVLWHQIRDWAFILGPYLVFVCFVLGAAVVGVANPAKVERSRTSMYCVIRVSTVGNSSAIFTTLFVIVALVFEILILRHVYRNWQAVRSEGSPVPLNFLTRMSIFTVLVVIAVGVGVMFLVGSTSAAPNLFLAFLPFAAFVIFGTQDDILHVWCFWESDRFRGLLSSDKSARSERKREEA